MQVVSLVLKWLLAFTSYLAVDPPAFSHRFNKGGKQFREVFQAGTSYAPVSMGNQRVQVKLENVGILPKIPNYNLRLKKLLEVC